MNLISLPHLTGVLFSICVMSLEEGVASHLCVFQSSLCIWCFCVTWSLFFCHCFLMFSVDAAGLDTV